MFFGKTVFSVKTRYFISGKTVKPHCFGCLFRENRIMKLPVVNPCFRVSRPTVKPNGTLFVHTQNTENTKNRVCQKRRKVCVFLMQNRWFYWKWLFLTVKTDKTPKNPDLQPPENTKTTKTTKNHEKQWISVNFMKNIDFYHFRWLSDKRRSFKDQNWRFVTWTRVIKHGSLNTGHKPRNRGASATQKKPGELETARGDRVCRTSCRVVGAGTVVDVPG